MVDPPPCLGKFEPTEPECSGSEADPRPCTWRDRCGAFRTYLRRAKQCPRRWLDLEGWEIRRWCDQWIEAYDIERGLPKGEQPPAVVAGSLREGLDRLVAYLIDNAHRLGRVVANGRLALPGELYLTDRLKTSRYVALHVRSHQGHDRAFVRLQLKPRARVIEVRLPIAAPEAAQAFEVEAVAIKVGQYRSRLALRADDLERAGPRLLALAISGVLKL